LNQHAERRHDHPSLGEENALRLSTRNQLTGAVTSIQSGEAMAVVKVTHDTGQAITASITREAAEDLTLAEGSPVTVLVKSTEVMLAVE
jgi:molybdopterin-binding protein